MIFLWINYLLAMLALSKGTILSNESDVTKIKCQYDKGIKRSFGLDNLDASWTQLEHKVEISKQMRHSPNLQTIEHDLLLAFNQAFPNQTASIHFFGSRIAGVGKENSDLDVHANIDSTSWGTPKEITTQQLYKAANFFHKEGNQSWELLNTIVYTRVPIICLTHIPTKITVDINFSRKASAANDELANYMFDLQPIGRYMVQYLRDRAKSLQLDSYLRSHHHVLMVIFFLQMKNLLPSVHYLQNNIEPDVGPVVSHFHKLSYVELGLTKVEVCPDNANNLLKEYFEFYQSFNYDKYALSPYHRSKIPRSKLISLMPKGYKINIRDWITPVAIQNMANLSSNNGKALKLKNLMKFLSVWEQFE